MKKAGKNSITTIIIIVIFLAGLSLLLYPTLSDYWNDLHQSKAIAGYADQVSAMDPDQYEKLWEEAEAYNQTLLGKSNRFQMTKEEQEEYDHLLAIPGTDVIGYIEIAKINLSLPIYHGTDEKVLQKYVGHLEGSSLPVGGESTHCVISGHRGLPSAKLFTNLDRLELGDTFVLSVLDQTLTYQVDQIRIVNPWEVEELEIVKGKDYCTLITCTPYGINTHRLLVRGHRVKNEANSTLVPADAWQIEPVIVGFLMVFLVLFLLFIGLMIKTRRKAKERRGSGS